MLKKKISIIISVILLFCFTITSVYGQEKTIINDYNNKNELILTLPIGNGEGKIAYSEENIDAERFGPESFAIFNDMIYILDSVDKQIEIFDFKTNSIKTIKLPQNYTYYDMEVENEYSMVLLTYNGSILTINNLGEIIYETEILLKNEKDILGQILSKTRNNFVEVKNINDHTSLNAKTNMKNTDIDGVRILSNNCDNLNQTFLFNNKNINIKYKYQAGLTYPLKSINKNEVMFYEEDVLLGNSIYVEGKVSRYIDSVRKSMSLLEPTINYEIIPNKFIYCTDNGIVYQMVCDKSNIYIYKLTFTEYERSNIDNTEKNVISNENSLTNIEVFATHTRQEIADSAVMIAGILYDWTWTFDYTKHVSPNNTTCTPPDHLDESSESGIVTGIPYKWGGFDNMVKFLENLKNGYKAGDINTAAVTSNTAGVDCSGYISRAYKFATKLGTSTIPTYFDSTTYDDLLIGEIANRKNYHVFIFGGYIKKNGQITGCVTLEATTDGYIDAIKPWERTLNDMQLYTPMKLKTAYYSNFD